VLRYSRLLETAKRIIDSRVLGQPLHATFENCASDEALPPEHWFWDPDMSGGIFVEHGVHFFDLYAWWFGNGCVVSAGSQTRRQTNQEDRAYCTVGYDSGVVAQFYHGFDQPARLDRADNRVLLERGDIQVLGWIPMELRVHGIVDDAQRAELNKLCPDWHEAIIDHYGTDEADCRGRGNDYRVTMRARWNWQLPAEQRQDVYAQLFQSLLADQIQKTYDPTHILRLTAEDARNAVAAAEQARQLAAQKR
jgi:predicted dehydrogenase